MKHNISKSGSGAGHIPYFGQDDVDPELSLSLSAEEEEAVERECADIRTHEQMRSYLRGKIKGKQPPEKH